MADLDEELQAHQEEVRRQQELQAEQEEGRRKRQIAQGVLRQKVKKSRAAAPAKKVIKREAAAALQAIGTAILDFLVAAAPVIGIILLILAFIILVVVTVAVLCNSNSWAGRFIQFSSAVTAFVGITDQDYCSNSTFTSIGKVIDTGETPPPGGEFCPANIKPPPGAVIDCSSCVDITQEPWQIPIKPGVGHFADRAMADLLLQLKNKNSTWRLTEAFCPTINHLDPKHYNGKAVDMDLQPPYSGDRLKFAQVYADAKNLPFSAVVCEPAGYIPNVNCKTFSTTTGPNIHVELP